MDIRGYNRIAWDREVERGNQWTIPVSEEIIARARQGQWEILLTPSKPVPRDWFPELKGLDVLCLASGGGQQGPVLAVAGRSLVLELLLEGRIMGAEEAERRGLVSRLVADADLEAEVQATAGRIAGGAPLANRATKKFLNRLADPRPLSGAEIDEGYALCDSADYAEGLRAFLAK